MNDIDITYNKKTGKYSISIETIYMFNDGREGEKRYIKRLFDKLTEWMYLSGYDTNLEVNLQDEFEGKDASLYDVFTAGKVINTEFDSIEELYTSFKFLVNNFTK